jgi:hypothetical protein
MKHQGSMTSSRTHTMPYRRLATMVGLSFASMYILMYAMVDRVDNLYPNLNQLYMAALMTAPMLIIELLLMKEMYSNRKLNLLLVAAGVAALFSAFGLIRQQVAIGDRQFLKSMIPHHAGAILMCQQAPVHSPEVTQLCQSIISSQQHEIEQMKALLAQQ